MTLTPIEIATLCIIALFCTAALSSLFTRHQSLLINLAFTSTTLISLACAVAGAWTVAAAINQSKVLIIGLPDLPFHLRLDPLSGFFLTMIGTLSAFVSVYSIGYVKGFIGQRPVTSMIVFYCLFLAAMIMVILADDALFFLISWEVMAASSYFLVIFENEKVENRRAAFLYMVVAHVGAIGILLSFGVLAGFSSGFGSFEGYTFEAMRHGSIPAGWATAAFLLSFFGFAAKAGVVPLHIWLPEAHPVAPSNVSSLMSGIMIKTAIYGIIRVIFDLIREFPWWWGSMVLVFGLISAVIGILFAMMEKDIKRLLAYSSVKNIGIILVGIGLSMVFHSAGLGVLAALALIAGMYHALNHAMFKGLLFMGAGAVLHATNERNMDEMGGLIHKMPWTAALFLVGCISIAALPPFNGFVSEWLTFQAFLLSQSLQSPIMKLIIPLGAALLALSSALAAGAFVKAFGVTFLGHWRGRKSPNVHEANWPMRIGMIMAAVSCLALGTMPTIVIEWMDVIAQQLTGATLSSSAGFQGWLWLTPVSPDRASYSGMIVFLGLIVVVVTTYIFLHVKPGTVHKVPIWDCGFEKLTPRMQYNSISFAMPFRVIFGYLFSIKERVRLVGQQAHAAFPKHLKYRLRLRDRLWGWLYRPIMDVSFWLSRKAGSLQQGRINTYLIYSFITILVLLVFLR